MKAYTFNQVRKALENKGFEPGRGFGNEEDGFTTCFEKKSNTGGWEFATVEERFDEVTIDGKHPTTWYKESYL
jgi:hypothetical protein